MKNKTLLLMAASFFINVAAFAQPYAKSVKPQVFVNGIALNNAWAGGLNSTSFNTIDMNGDGIKDLFLFDKQFESAYSGVYKMRTFINNGTSNTVDYHYDPFYERFFPSNMVSFCILKDYDCDGDEDIFTYNKTSSGVDVYTNNPIGGNPNFTLTYSPLPTCIFQPNPPCFQTSLFVSGVSQPIFADVNGDGDLDVLTFQSAANFIEYHENLAQELFLRCDTFVLKQLDDQWGHVGLSPFSNTAILGFRHGLHSGSCMIGYDEGADGDIDIINGDLLGNNLLYLNNNALIPGVNDSINFQDSLFPLSSTAVDYVTFPSPYLFDADNDGVEDLLVSSCSEKQSENKNNNLFYKNTGNNAIHNFQFIKKGFLTDEMIDAGCASNPVFFDADGDGKKDLIIGNDGYFIHDSTVANGHLESSLTLFKNTSTGACPRFDWITNDYSSLQTYQLLSIFPAFGDLDGDGDDDMLIGNEAGNLYYFKNTSPPFNPAQFSLAPNGVNYQNIDVGKNSTPQLIDVDFDGLIDLLIGEQLGRIFYYHNTGTASNPVFSFVTNSFGGVFVTNTAFSTFGYSTPCMFLDNGIQKLLVGSEKGNVFLYDNITGNLGGTFNLVSNSAYGVFEPPRVVPAIADLNSDGLPEIVAGNFAGGLSFYSRALPGCPTAINQHAQDFSVSIYPNPVTDRLVIEQTDLQPSQLNIDIYDLPGKLIAHHKSADRKNYINLTSASKGIYVVKITSGTSVITKKIIVQPHENK